MTRSRHLLRTSSALAALSTALVMGAPVQAQGLLANPFVNGGDAVAQVSTSTNQTNVLVNANQAIIDWRPTTGTAGATMNVLPEGNSLFFDANSSVTDFTVLNRIALTDDIGAIDFRPIELNGTIQSRIGNGFGGNVWFYSPGGILVGATGRFDVGGLVLTTNPIDVTDGLYGTNQEIRFRGTDGSPYGVTVNAGAQINALATGSYVAIVAPSVIMNGQVNVDGSAAYVGAEQADLRINGGLFDIAITVGTSQAHGVEHNGTTTGPASTSAADTQRAVMVAVPKNQAMTMLLSGSIGYTAATDATLEGSAVVLSAGHDIREGAIWTRSPAAELGAIAIGTADFSSAVTGQATGTITIDPATSGTTLFQSTASFGAQGNISVVVTEGETVRAQQGLSLTSTIGAAGGAISLTADRGLIDVTPGTLNLNARGDAQNEFSGTGGTITLNAIGGGRIAAGQIDADAGASAGPSRNATGGSVTLDSSLGGVIEAAATNLRASGDALFSDGEPNPTGGDGTGGAITIQSTVGRLQLGDVNAVAQASAGNASSGQGGTATGGDIVVNLSGGTHQWSSLFADVSTAAGYTTQGGTSGGAQGGDTGIFVSVTGSETTLDITRSVSLYADGRSFGGGAGAGAVRGGDIFVGTGDGGTIQVAQDLYAQSRGDGSNFNIAQDTQVAPDVFGGRIDIQVNSGAISAGALLLYADAAAGFGDVRSGVARGGTVVVDVNGGTSGVGSLTLTDCPIYSCQISAGARGGSALAGSDAFGGRIIVSNLGLFSYTGQLYVEANGQGGRSINGGNGQGANGTGGLIDFSNDGTANLGELYVEASGSASETSEGFFIGSGSGGIGQGGTARFSNYGNLTAALARVTANGEGGFAGANCVECTADEAPFTAGNGVGGTVGILFNGGAANIGLLSGYADGLGGTASSGQESGDIAGIAGNGTGGNVRLEAFSGGLIANSLILSANGQGGMTQDAVNLFTNSGGTGTGGSATFAMEATGTAVVAIPNMIVRAEGIGGNAGTIRLDPDVSAVVTAQGAGGNATGGNAGMVLASGTLTAASISLSAEGTGGNGSINETPGSGGSAGSASGGTATFSVASGGHGLTDVVVSAIGEGGLSRDGNAAGGSSGGNGTGGTARAALAANGSIANLTVAADGIGSDGNQGATPGNGGIGRGGIAELAATAGTFVISNRLSASADGEGGAVGLGRISSTRFGGDGIGGGVAVAVNGPATVLRVANVAATADGDGGDGGPTTEPGGNGTGGIADIAISQGGTLAFTGLAGISTFGNGVAGGAGRGGGSTFRIDGGTATSGPGAALRIDSGARSTTSAIAGSSQLLLTNAAAALPGVTLSAVSDVSASGTGRGGSILIRNDGTATGGRAAASLTADASAIGAGTAGQISLIDEADAGSFAVSGAVALTALGTADPAASGVVVRSTKGAVTTGNLAVVTSGPIGMDFAGAGALRASGSAGFNSDGDISVVHNNRTAGTDSLYAAQQLQMTAGGAITGGAGSQLRSGGNAIVQADTGNIALARLGATGNVDLRAPQGAITVSEDLASGGTVTATAALGIDIRALADLDVSTASAGLTSAIAIVGDRALTLANIRGGSIRAQAGSALSLQTATAAAGGIAADSINANVTLTNAVARDAVTSQAGGTVGLTSVRASSADIAGASGVTLTDVGALAGGIRTVSSAGGSSLTDISATGAIDVSARDAVALNRVAGASLAVSGGALDLRAVTATAGGVQASGSDIVIADMIARDAVSATASGTASATNVRAASLAMEAATSATLVDSIATAGNVRVVSTAGEASLRNVTASGAIAARAGSTLTATALSGTALTLEAGGSVALSDSAAAAGGVDVSGLNGTLTGVTASDAITARIGDALNATNISGAALTLTSGGNLSLTDGVARTGAVTVVSNIGDVALLRITGGGAVIGRAGDMLTATDVTGATLGFDAGGDVALSNSGATGGAVSVTGANIALTDIGAVGGIFAQARTALTGANITGANVDLIAAGGVSLTDSEATAGFVRVDNGSGPATLGRITASGDILARSGGALTISDARSVALAADGVGDVALTNVATSAGDIRVNSSGGFARLADTTSASNLVIRGTGGIGLDGQVRARALADIETAAAIAVNGQLTGGQIALTSADLAIAAAGGILAAPDAPGTAGQLTLNATGSGTTFLGGPANGGGYSLSGTEMAALRSRSLTINANGAVEIGSFTMTAGAEGNIGDLGLFSILSPTTIRVNGAVRIDTMPRSAQLLLGATQRIVVDPATGLIDLRSNAPGGLGGIVRLRSNAVYVATDAAITAIAGLTDPTLIDARLAQNDGIVRPDNIVRAIDIVLEVGDGAYIQNLGAGTGFDQRRGFLATGSTLDIDTASADTRVVINGQLQDDATPVGLLSGLTVAPIIMVNGVRGPAAGGRFDQRSTVNGCLMINPGSCAGGVDPVVGGSVGGVGHEGGPQAPLTQSGQDVLETILDPAIVAALAAPSIITTIELRDFTPQAYLPLIDEPVTGAGNDDLWQCDEDKPGCARPNP